MALMSSIGVGMPTYESVAEGVGRHLFGKGPGWNSGFMHGLYETLGWFSFIVWSISFYPQVILNYQRKSVVGFNFDFLVFNLTKHTSYLIFNLALFFSPVVQQQYHELYGPDALIPVSSSDVGFSLHAVALTIVTAVQIFQYQRGGQRVSKLCVGITATAWTAALLALIYASSSGAWLWIAFQFNYMQLLFTSIKYIPQAYMNFQRRSTVGWSIGNILLDISGGLGALFQMIIFSFDQHTAQNFLGNVGKLGLSLETIAFDVLFIVQHYVLYPHRGGSGVWHDRESDSESQENYEYKSLGPSGGSPRDDEESSTV